MPHSIETIASTRKKTKESIRVDSLVPSDLREPAEALIDLLEDYYTHINEIGQPSAEINSMVEARDIDVTKAAYLDLIQKEIARVNLYKNLARYYNVRGSKESIELFFKIIFQDNAEVYFPRKDMLIASDGVWLSNVQRPVYSAAPLLGVIGNGTGAKAMVTTSNGAIRRITVSNGGTLYPCPTASITGDGTNAVLELYVAGGIVRSIKVLNGGSGYTNATVVIAGTSTTLATATAEIVAGAISSVTVTAGGSGYASPTVTITGNGSGAAAIAYCAGGVIKHIQMLTYGSGYSTANIAVGGATGSGAVAAAAIVNGAITQVNPTSYGSGYTTAKVAVNGIVLDDSAPNSTYAQIIPNVDRSGNDSGQITSYIIADCGQGYTVAGNFLGYSNGTYNESRGFLSDNIKLQDSYFYQKFSYVIRTGNNFDVWSDTFNKLVHPAGMIFFGEILILLQLLDSKSIMPLLQPGLISAEDLARIIILQAANNLTMSVESSYYSMVLKVPIGTNTSFMLKFFDYNTMDVYQSMSIEQAETLYPYDDHTIESIINSANIADPWPTGYSRNLYIGTQTWNGTPLGINFTNSI
jgi:hypothetical protein